MLHVGILPHHRRGATSSPTSRSSSSTRPTSTAASSARTSPTSCAACAGSPPPTAPTPRFLLASATIANPVELAERLTGLDDFTLDRPRRRRRSPPRRSRCGTRRSRRGAPDPPQRVGRGGRHHLRPRHATTRATICFIKSRKAVELVARLVAERLERGGARARRHRSRPTAPATPPSSAASSSGA